MFTAASLCDMEHQPSIEDKDLRLGFDELGASVRWPIHLLPIMIQSLTLSRATGFGIARATSLGVVTSDLSCKSLLTLPLTPTNNSRGLRHHSNLVQPRTLPWHRRRQPRPQPLDIRILLPRRRNDKGIVVRGDAAINISIDKSWSTELEWLSVGAE
jgi:hypothetical protein